MNNKETMLHSFARYVFLNVSSMIGFSIYILADTFFIANGLGSQGLAALNLALPVYNLINGFGLMLSIGGATNFIVSRTTGDREKSNRIFSTAVSTGITLGVIFMLIGIFLTGPITHFLGADDQTYAMSYTYVRWLCLFAPMYILNTTLSAFVKNDGNPRLAMLGMVFGSLFNIVFDYIFIFILGLGMFGAVLATGCSPVVGILILLTHFRKGDNGFSYHFRTYSFKRLRYIVSCGVPSFVMELAAGIVMFTFNILILGLEGNDGVAAYGILANILIVVTCVYNGIAQGAQPLFGEKYALKDSKGLMVILRYSMVTVAFTSLIFYGIIFGFTDSLIQAFNGEGNEIMRQLAASGFPLYFSQCLFLGCNIVLIMYFVSIGYPKHAQIMSILKGCVIIVPLAIIFSKLFGIAGVWIVTTVTELLVLGLGLVFFWRASLKS